MTRKTFLISTLILFLLLVSSNANAILRVVWSDPEVIVLQASTATLVFEEKVDRHERAHMINTTGETLYVGLDNSITNETGIPWMNNTRFDWPSKQEAFVYNATEGSLTIVKMDATDASKTPIQ